MGVPVDNRSIAQSIKALETALARLRGEIASFGGNPDDQIHDPLGNVIFAADIDAGSGILKPRLGFTISTPSQATAVTATSWVEAFTVAGYRQNATVAVRFNVTAAAGSTGSVRAVVAGTSTELHAPVTIADGDTQAMAWTLTLPGNWDTYDLVEIQAERLTGSGTITVRPYSAAGG
jgi:hypothetical protein